MADTSARDYSKDTPQDLTELSEKITKVVEELEKIGLFVASAQLSLVVDTISRLAISAGSQT
jgi:hypothetical protein